MRDERDRRRPSFQPGLGLRLADGQVWSFPVPADFVDGPAGPSRAWDGPDYRGILGALAEAEDEGERFRAELALAIHLLSWNYEVDREEIGALLDDQDGGRIGVDVARSLGELARAHVGSSGGRRPVDDRRPAWAALGDGIRRLIDGVARGLGRRAARPANGRAGLTAYAPLARPPRSSSPGAR